jgi:hypothetical protein
MRFLLGLLIFFVINTPVFAQSVSEGAIKVEIRENDGKFTLYRGGKPYYINGVGGQIYLDRAVAYGANSLRTWGAGEAINILDEAHKKGLTVLFGLWVGQERQGFDYDDAKAVQSQLDRFTEVVKTYKDHPAVLMWGIGNENDLMYENQKVWTAINDIAKMIHEVDPNHPTMNVTAGLDVAEVQLIKERAPHLDIYGINTYGELIGIDQKIRSYGWDGPYIITEWGPNGHWEVPTTAWGAPIEQTSAIKAQKYRQRYQQGIARDPDRCLGSYVFLWGQKQETTPTWYGLFTEDGEETEVMDELQQCWTGTWPENRAPHIESFTLNGLEAISSVYLKPGRKYTADVKITDPNGDKLDYEWIMLESEIGLTGTGGDAEVVPDEIKIKIMEENDGELTFKAPLKEGGYRLFVYARDGKGKVATANFPFYVRIGSGSR